MMTSWAEQGAPPAPPVPEPPFCILLEQVDNWMLLCRINQQFQDAGNQMSDNEAVDWFQEVRAAVPTDLLKESPGWIYSQRKEAEELGHQ